MRRSLLPLTAAALFAAAPACGAARDVKDAAQGLASAGKEAEEMNRRYERSLQLTFLAEYERRDAGGKVTRYTVVQKPPRGAYRFEDGSGLFDDGTSVVSCSKGTGGASECIEVGPHTDGGFVTYGAGLGVFNPALFFSSYVAASLAPGVEAGKSTREVAGLRSECVSIAFQESGKPKRLEGCTSDEGVFTFSDDGETRIELKRYTTSVTEADLALPAPKRTADDVVRDATSTTSPATTSTVPGGTSTTSVGADETTSTTDELGG